MSFNGDADSRKRMDHMENIDFEADQEKNRLAKASSSKPQQNGNIKEESDEESSSDSESEKSEEENKQED